METTKKIIAFTDNVTDCDCCGKSNLKGTFCVEINGNEFYYGSTCAFKKHGFDKKETTSIIKKYNDKIDFLMIKTAKELTREFGYNNYTEEIFNQRLQINKSICFGF